MSRVSILAPQLQDILRQVAPHWGFKPVVKVERLQLDDEKTINYLNQNCVGMVHIERHTVYFENEHDATIFILLDS
jgi:hypothetical protein